MNEKRYTLVIILTIAIVILYYFRQSNNSLTQTTNSTTVTSLITKVREIKELRCAAYQEELVITKEKTQTFGGNNVERILPNFAGESDLFANKIVLIIKGTAYAGIDLSKLSENDILVRNDSLFCHLPSYKIMETIVNPKDIEVYSQKGDWSQSEINTITIEAKKQINQNATKNHLLETARKSGEKQLGALLGTSGYSTIVFSYRE